jgi:hypothetical protein
LWNARMARRKVSSDGKPVPPSGLLNSCHAYNPVGPVVRELYPAHYTGTTD